MPTTRTIAYVIVEEMKHRKRHDACLMCFKTLHLLPKQPVHHLPPAPKAKDILGIHRDPIILSRSIERQAPNHKMDFNITGDRTDYTDLTHCSLHFKVRIAHADPYRIQTLLKGHFQIKQYFAT